MSAPPLNLPADYRAMGAPAPECYLSADGSAFYGVQSKHNGTDYAFRVFRQLPDGSVATLVLAMPIADARLGGGQGSLQLQADGTLAATAYAAPGDGRLPICLPVPNWLPPAREDAPLAQIYHRCVPTRTHPSCNGVVVPDGRLDMVALFGISGAVAYAMRMCPSGAPNVRARLGPDAADPAQFTVCTQLPGQEIHENGIVNAADDGSIYYSAINGRPAVSIQVVGFWR